MLGDGEREVGGLEEEVEVAQSMILGRSQEIQSQFLLLVPE